MHSHRPIALLALATALLGGCGAPSVATVPSAPTAGSAPARAPGTPTAPTATITPPSAAALPSPAVAPPSPQELAHGVKVDVGGYHLFITCTGQGSPAVVLDAGASNYSGAWHRVQPEVAAFTQVCSYDRSSRGRSDLGPVPNTSQQMVTDLRTLLANVQIAGPYVLVGSSFGGLTMQLFARLYPTEAAGLVLVDATHEEFYLDPAVNPCPQGECAAIKLQESAQQLLAAPLLPAIPLIVLRHGRASVLGPAADERWPQWQQDLAARSPHGQLIVAEKSGHNIELLQPELVVAAIRDVSEQVRR